MEWGISRLAFCGVPMLRAELRGPVTIEDEIAFVAALETEAGEARGLIVDISAADTSGLSAEDIRAMAKNWQRSRFGNEHPLAAYTTSRAPFPVASMLLAHWDPDLMYLFRSEREALEWLAKRVHEWPAPESPAH